MKPSAPLTLDTTRKMNRWMLVICIAMLVASELVGVLTGGEADLVRLYAFNALFVELACIYIPATIFIDRNGGKNAFGFVRVSGWEWAWAILLGIGVFFLSTAVNGFTQLLWKTTGANTELFEVPLPTDGGWRLFASIFLIAFIPAFAEETLFRGALLHAWTPQGRVKALWHSAILFTLIHFQPASFPAYLLLSLFLGAVTLLTGSVFPAMAVHGVNNLLGVLITYFASGELASGAAEAALTADILPGLLFYAVLGFAACFAGYKGIRAAAASRTRLAEEESDQPEFHRLEFDVHKPNEEPAAQAAASQAPATVKKGSGALIATYVVLGLINLFVLLAMFIELPQSLAN